MTEWTEQDLRDLMNDLLNNPSTTTKGMSYVAICYADENGNCEFLNMFDEACKEIAKNYKIDDPKDIPDTRTDMDGKVS